MDMNGNGSRPSTRVPGLISELGSRGPGCFRWGDPMRLNAGRVTFSSRAHAQAWHTHPLGQTLIITMGCGWVQTDGGPIEEVRPGDVVWFPTW